MKKYLTIPNIITMLRIASFPLMIICLFLNNEQIFKWLLLFALLSDILDGFIARTFKMESELGSKLDSAADLLMYISAVSGLIIFKLEFLINYKIFIGLVILIFLITRVINIIFLKIPFNSYHSYLSKAMAYLQGAFIMSLFLFGFIPYIFYPALIVGIISNIEEILIMFILKKDKQDIKGLYWVLKK